MDDKTKQMVMDKLAKMKEKREKEEAMMKMDEGKMKTMLDKAMKVVDEWGMDARDTMIMGKMIKLIGKAMTKEGDW